MLVSAVQQLRQAQEQDGAAAHSVQSAPLSTRRWRLADRLGEADIEQLIAAFASGTSKRELVDRYGISESSVKRLVRQYGVSKLSSRLCLPPALVRWSNPWSRRLEVGSDVLDGVRLYEQHPSLADCDVLYRKSPQQHAPWARLTDHGR